jgi:hypothetical protein
LFGVGGIGNPFSLAFKVHVRQIHKQTKLLLEQTNKGANQEHAGDTKRETENEANHLRKTERAGWPDEFMKLSPKNTPSRFLNKIYT